MNEAKFHQRLQTVLALGVVAGLFLHLGKRDQQLDSVVGATENLTKAVAALTGADLVKTSLIDGHERRLSTLESRK